MHPLGIALLALQSASGCGDAPAAAQPFAPNLADSARLYRGTFSADGRTLYYFRKQTPGQEDYRILVSHFRDGAWSPGERLDLGGDFSDLYPSVSPDGRRLVFASYRPAPGDTASAPNAYLWYADRQGNGWGPARFIGNASRFGTYHSGPVIDSSLTIRFHRTSGDWRTQWEMVSRWTPAGYAAAEEPGADDPAAPWRNWRPNRLHVWGGQLSPRGDFTVLGVSPVDSATGRRGPADVWVSLRRGHEWTEPVPAGGEVNRAGYENFVVFHPDGCSVIFVRNFSAFHRVSIDGLLAPARAQRPSSGAPRPQQPERVMPGVVSLEGRNETFPAIDPVDGALWFSVYDQDFGKQTIMRAPRRGSGWAAGEVAPFSGTQGDRAPRFSPDGRRLYFTSNRPAPGHPEGDFNIWMVERHPAGWSAATLVPAPVNSPAGRDIHNVVLPDGSMYLASNRPGGAGRSDIWHIIASGEARHLGAPINDDRSQPDLYVSPDGQWMLLVITDHPAGLGGDDLFISRWSDGAWTAPRPLGAPVNSPEYEYGSSVSPDGRLLYFTSHRGGSADLYVVELAALGLSISPPRR